MKWEEEDPIGIFRRYLIDEGIGTEEELDDQDSQAADIVDEAVKFAEDSPDPDDDALFEHIYAEPTPIEYRGYALSKESEGN